MISWINVKGLNNRFDYDLDFNSGLNLLTAESGGGKTTLLKLIWYLTSGNIHRVIREIPLASVEIGTTQFDLSVKPVKDKIKLEWQFDSEERKFETMSLEQGDSPLYELNKKIANATPSSLFLSTFRRLEGGFTAEPTTRILKQALAEFSAALSSDRHKFITSISTHDIVELLTQKYCALAKLEHSNWVDDRHKFEDLRHRWSDLEIEILGYYTMKYPGGIRISKEIILGVKDEKQEALLSTKLSSGEKQYLGFLCCAAFSESGIFFIDEPELSLHVDLQRILIESFKKLAKEKQFFIATHTPFIYSRYPESEIQLDRQLKR